MIKNRKILIVTDSFPPNFAPRMGLLSYHLEKMGWDVTIISEDNSEIHYNLPNLPKKVYRYNYQANASKTEYYLKSALNLIYDHKTNSFLNKFYKEIKNEYFDLVLCSTFNEFPLNLAYKISKKLNIPLLCDIRDLAEQFGSKIYDTNGQTHNYIGRYFTNLLRKRRIQRRNYVLKKANAITTISPWHLDFIKRYNKNVYLIYNGFSEKDFIAKEVKSNSFNIVYTGRLLDLNTRNPELLFNAIEELKLEKLRIVWYVDKTSREIISKELENYPITKSISEINNLVPVSAIPNLLNKSSIILVLTNKSTEDGPKGIMTTKFFEAIGVEKPVLCVRSDEGCLSQVIKETNAGLAATNVEEVKSFITKKYKEWENNGFTRQEIVSREKFSRENQAKQFVEIFNSLIK
ncbi:MAG: glycosyltransferase [Paludibacteraceae bacterium]|nr:glycosyltransferase [Paludibacteraceae bacterium]